MATKSPSFIRWFEEISIDDIPLVGGKNASLGEMYQQLSGKGVSVPNGFALTAEAYRHFLDANNLWSPLREMLAGLDPSNIPQLQERGRSIRNLLLGATLPQDMADQVLEAYRQLGGRDVAVRSSATAEDLPDASFAGQQETFLNVHGSAPLLQSVVRCFASLFTDRAISYRTHHGYEHDAVALSVGVQVMVRSDLACSGVMFSIDTETGFKDAVLISAAYGLGETVVQGTVNPDEYYVFKPTLLAEGKRPILRRRVGEKAIKMVYDQSGGRQTRTIPVATSEQQKLALQDDEVLALARWAKIIEDYYSEKNDRFVPMDMEWAKDGETGELFIVQARPETVHAQKQVDQIKIYKLKEKGQRLLEGRAVGEKIAVGPVRNIKSVEDLNALQQGEVLVADRTDPDWEPAMKRASAIITNRGGRTCHAAIVSRELGLPAVVGCSGATTTLLNGQAVTVDCSHGDTGDVYAGELAFDIKTISVKELQHPKTKIMMNVANPDEAFRLSFLPCSGVGLARLEFIINNTIKIHPLALVNYASLEDSQAREKIEAMTIGWKDKRQYFVDKLAEGVGMIGAAFYPKDVIVRMSDFKTNEYAHLVGGEPYEPQEDNPMIGFRGASRYYHDLYRQGFALECQAMRKVREEIGLTNVKLMIPFCRTVDEGKLVLAEMAKHGLERGKNGLEVYVMCEIPANVICADQFAEVFDGFSIGSNDLTQLTLGVDRDSELLAPLFQERNDAVKRMISMVIKVAKEKGRKIGICGQAPSDYPEFAEFLVREGIDSMSLLPDVVIKTSQAVAALEKTLAESRRV